MAQLMAKRFDAPDEVREFTDGTGRTELVTLAGTAVGLSSYEPGWRWSTNVRPIVGTDSCHVEQVGYVLKGRLSVRLDDGSEHEFQAGDAFHVPPDHDAWTVGDETCVVLDFGGLIGYAKAG